MTAISTKLAEMKRKRFQALNEDIDKIWNKNKTHTSFKRLIKNLVLRQQKLILSEAIEIFNPHKDEPMTGNVVNLELKALRGDYK